MQPGAAAGAAVGAAALPAARHAPEACQRMGPGSAQYVGQAVPVLLDGCRDRNANVRQCSVYGLGVLAEHRPEHFRPVAGEAVARMLEMVTAPGSRRAPGWTIPISS